MSQVGPLLQDGVNPKWIPKKNISKSLIERNVVHPEQDSKVDYSDTRRKSAPKDEFASDAARTCNDKTVVQKRVSSADPLKRDRVERSLGRRASTCHFLNYDENWGEAERKKNATSTEERAKSEAVAKSEVDVEVVGGEAEEDGEESLGLVFVNECKKQLGVVSRIFIQDSESSDMEMETLMDDDNGEPNDSKGIAKSESVTTSEILHLTLHQCARDGDNSSIQLVIDYLAKMKTLKKNLNKHDDSDLSPLHYAVRYGHIDIVKLLIEYGAKINNRGAYGASATLCCEI